VADSKTAGADEGSGSPPIFVIDDLRLRAGQLDPFLEALETRYRPGAEARGQRLLHVLVNPPTRALDMPYSVVLLWEIDGIAGFWGVRSQNAAEDVVAFWRDCDAQWVESRTRRTAAASTSLASLDAVGQVNA
jgi:hypothetical protein